MFDPWCAIVGSKCLEWTWVLLIFSHDDTSKSLGFAYTEAAPIDSCTTSNSSWATTNYQIATTCTFQKSSKVILQLFSIAITSSFFTTTTFIVFFTLPNTNLLNYNKSSKLCISSRYHFGFNEDLDNLFSVYSSFKTWILFLFKTSTSTTSYSTFTHLQVGGCGACFTSQTPPNSSYQTKLVAFVSLNSIAYLP